MRAACHPRATEAKQTMVETIMFTIAANHRLSVRRFQVCKLNEEKVLSPPQAPTAKNCCNPAAISVLPRRRTAPDITPIKPEATTFTTNVPKGKVSPNRSAIQPDHQNRHMLPSAPPMNTKRVGNMSPWVLS